MLEFQDLSFFGLNDFTFMRKLKMISIGIQDISTIEKLLNETSVLEIH